MNFPARLSLLFATVLFASGAPTLHLLQKPAMNKSVIVFEYAGDLWTVPRQGGTASRLTAATGFETDAYFSPDGSTLAFSGEYDGNTDVFTIPVAGGVPKRITYHPDADRVVGWSPDGSRILFRSNRLSFSRYTQLFTVAAQGGLPEVLPLPMACTGAYSPDGKEMVYAPLDGGQFATGFTNYVAWKRYRGGEASYLWLVNFADLSTVKIPRTDSNDIDPMWIGDKIYFLSDRDNGHMTLWRYDPRTKQVAEVIKPSGKDILSASAGPGGIVYEQFGQIHIYDTASGKTSAVAIDLAADLSEVRPHFQNVSREIRSIKISPTGMRAVFEAHGEILTAPAEKGDIRNLTDTPGVMERTPVWSPDGRSIAFFSDESGEYALHIKSQTGEGETRKIPLDNKSNYYFDPKWSPDSKQIAFIDNEDNFWNVDIASSKLTKIDTDYAFELNRDFAWSPDSKYLAFVKFLPSRLHALFIYSLDNAKSTQVTDGMSDVRHPAFDRGSEYLYFTASTNFGPTISGLDMTSDDHDVTRSVYVTVLANNVQSPLAPESDEEKPGEPGVTNEGGGRGRGGRGGAAAEPPAKPVRIDFEGIAERTIPLPLPARNYTDLEAGHTGVIYVLAPGGEGARGGGRGGAGGGGESLIKFDLKTRRPENMASGVAAFDLSSNGDKMLLRTGGGGGGRGGRGAAADGEVAGPAYVIVSALQPLKQGEGALHLADVEVNVDPRAEWKQMYHEVWRIERSYFYDAKLHGVNSADGEKEYEKYLDGLSSREDLNYIFREMLGEFTVGHLRGGGGTIPEPKRVGGGLLGADYEIVNGHYRLKKLYGAGSWNPQIQSPLVQPGLNVKPGDYLLAIDGQELKGDDDVSRLLEGKAGKHVTLRIAADPSGANSREVTILPVGNEQQLRHTAWIEDNRRKVDQMSDGKIAYVYMPDTGQGGLTEFTRYYFAQTDRKAAIIDERFNSGGQVADYVIDVLNRPLMGWWSPRYGAIYRTSAASILGPKVMLINEFAGSGGDCMPWMFHYTKTGTLVGKRTWGGLVGIGQYPTLMDGGTVTSPGFGFFSPDGKWDVENHGVTPDVEVDLDPRDVRDGHDPQLERAVKVAMEQMQKYNYPEPHRPPFPNYQLPLARPTGATGAANNN